jgi:predicted ester cyclase
MVDAETTRMNFLNMYDRAMHHADYGPTEEFCKPVFACTNPNYEISGIDGIKRSIDMQREAFEGLKFDINLSFATDDGIAIVWTMSGRHVKEIYGVPASGKHFSADGISVHELADGKSIGGWSCGAVRDRLLALYEEAKATNTLPVEA